MTSNQSTLDILLSKINLEQIAVAIIVFAVGLLVGYLLRILVHRTTIRFMPTYISGLLAKATYYVVVVIFAIMALSIMGINVSGLILAGGILGIILGFALQSIVSNLVSGIFLYWERPFKPGDIVEIEGMAGTVVNINIMSTRILGFDGIMIRIPNEKVFTSTIKNITAKPVRRLEFTLGIAYKEDAEKAYNVLREVVEKHPLVLVEPPPEIYVEELADSSVNIKVRVWVPVREWMNVRKELLWKLKKALSNAGIEIPFPQRDIWLRSPVKIILSRGGDQEES